MRFEPSSPLSKLKSVLGSFVAIAGWDVLCRRVETIQAWCERYPFLQHHYRKRHSIELEIHQLWKRKLATGRVPTRVEQLTAAQVSALGMATMVVKVHRRLSAVGRTRLAGMVHDSLKSDRGFLSLNFEMATVGRLLTRGFDVSFNDLESGGGFDFLAARDEVVAEVECKTISYDLGRKVHRKDFYHLARVLLPRIADVVASSQESSLRVELTLNGRMPSRQAKIEELSNVIYDQIQIGSGVYQHRLGEIRVFDLDVPPTQEAVAAATSRLTERAGTHALALTNERSSLIVTARSQKEDRVLEGMLKQLKSAAGQQLTSERPGLLFAMVEDVEPRDWAQLLEDSALRSMTEVFFADSRFAHVHSVLYSSEGEVVGETGLVWERGPQLVFVNAQNPRRSEPSLVFGPSGPARHGRPPL